MRCKEPNLDPRNWNETRRLGHQMLEDMFDYLGSVTERPAWQPIPDSVVQGFQQPVPRKGTDPARVYDEFKTNIMPYPTGNLHPRFFGWAVGNGTVTGMLAEMLASGMNPILSGFNQSATHIEKEVLRWLSILLGFPEEASGVLVSGGTMANLNGLAVARQMKAGFDVRRTGLHGQPPLRVYGSVETHSWIYKACELMGMGSEGFRAVPVDQNMRIDLNACKAMICEDLASGFRPICVIGTAGTTNTGSIDDLAGLRALADEFDLWFHVDGALGSLAALSERYKELVRGQELADSLALDLHKWGYLQYEVGCVLVRDPEAHKATFALAPAYLTSSQRGVSVNTTYYADRGLQLSRSFRALKVWMSFKEQGVDLLGQVIEKNINQIFYLTELIKQNTRLELLAPVSLNVACFRYNPGRISEESLNRLNEEIIICLQERGIAVPSLTRVKGKSAIRVCIVNHRTRQIDLDVLAEAICRIGEELNHTRRCA